jgi:hypothetical protein
MLLNPKLPQREDTRGAPASERAWPIAVVACLLVALVGVLVAVDRPSGPPKQVGTPLVHLHRIPPIYRMTYSWNPAGERIQQARRRLVSACMARHGFSYPAVSSTSAGHQDELWPYPFGLESLTRSSRPEDKPQPTETPHGNAYAKALLGNPEQRVTARGASLIVSRPATGCLAEAEQRLLGDSRVRWMQLTVLLREAEQTARQQLDHDPAFQELTALWKQCMRRAGFQAADPREVVRSLPVGEDHAAAPVAAADINCKRRTNLLTIGYTRLAHIQQQLLARQPSLAHDWAALHAAQDSAARTVLEPAPLR